MRGEHPAVARDNAVLFVDQHRVGEVKFGEDARSDLRDFWSLCVRAFLAYGISAAHRRRTIVSGNVTGKPRLCFFST